MDSFEWNKVMAAILVAGITAMSAGFIAKKAVSPHEVAAHGSSEMAAGSAAAAAPQTPDPVMALIAGADIEQGKKLSKACAACHTFDKGGADGVGPNLWNVTIRGRAKEPGFSYSAGMTEKGGRWTYDDLNHFLWKPKSFVSDTKMNFIGVKKPDDRAALIAWLRTLADSPPALPSAGDISAEEAELGGADAASDADAGSAPEDAHAAPAEESH